MKDLVDSGVLPVCEFQWSKGIWSSPGSGIKTEQLCCRKRDREKEKCAIVRPMGVKRAMKEPEIMNEKSLLIQEEMRHLLPMSFHPWNLPWEATQKEKPFHLYLVGCQQVAAAPCLTKSLPTSCMICLFPCLPENTAAKKCAHQKLFWHCWSSLAQIWLEGLQEVSRKLGEKSCSDPVVKSSKETKWCGGKEGCGV